MTKLSALILSFLSVSLTSCGGGSGEIPDETPQYNERQNVIVIFTDDQRFDTLSSMPHTAERFASEGLIFDSAYVTTPVCTPSRASFLSGGFYSHNAGVLSNIDAAGNGGWENFVESNTLAVRMKSSGYETAFIGKYMAGMYSMKYGARYVPPGWSYFFAVDYNYESELGWYDNYYIEGSSDLPSYTYERSTSSEYITDLETKKALAFLRGNSKTPFFLMVSYHAPHAPAIAAPQDELLFQDFLYRGRAWGEQDMSDKSEIILEQSSPGFFSLGRYDYFPPSQLRSLQSIDRGIDAIVSTLEELELSESTIIFYLSDNGLQWGEHNLLDKARPFEESIRVPMGVIAPNLSGDLYQGLVAANLDIPSTILDIANLPITGDGESLLPLINGKSIQPRAELFFENIALGSGTPFIWTAVIADIESNRWKYIDYQNGESELYNLSADPYEEANQLKDLSNSTNSTVRDRLSRDLEHFRPITLLDRKLPDGNVGKPYHHILTVWGDNDGATFELISDQLPAGITLNELTGELSGIPVAEGTYNLHLRVQSQMYSPFNGRRLSHSAIIEVTFL